MRRLLICMFGAGSFWDGVTSLLGIIGLFGVTDWKLELEYVLIYITSIIGSLLILALSINAEDIWQDGKYNFLMLFHIFAVIFDAYTSFLGTAQNVLLKDSRTAFITIGFAEVWEKTTFEQKIALIFVTVLITMSPIALSILKGESNSTLPRI